MVDAEEGGVSSSLFCLCLLLDVRTTVSRAMEEEGSLAGQRRVVAILIPLVLIAMCRMIVSSTSNLLVAWFVIA